MNVCNYAKPANEVMRNGLRYLCYGTHETIINLVTLIITSVCYQRAARVLRSLLGCHISTC